MIKQIKLTSSVTLILGFLFAGFAPASEADASDSFLDFQIQPNVPYVDSMSAYNLSFTLSAETYNRLHNARLAFQFPEEFGLEIIDSVVLVTNHEHRQYRIDRIMIEAQSLSFRLRRINVGDGNGDEDESDGVRVNFHVTVYRVHNALTTGPFQIEAKAIRGEHIIAGPTLSEEFTFLELEPGPGKDFENSFVIENNPFNPNDGPVKFRYELKESADIDFRVFTIAGEEVYTHRFFAGGVGGSIGQNEIEWDGRNHESLIVLNGVYVATVLNRKADQKASIKVAVLK